MKSVLERFEASFAVNMAHRFQRKFYAGTQPQMTHVEHSLRICTDPDRS